MIMKPSRYSPGLRQIAPPPGKRAGQMTSTAMTDADTTLNQTGDGLNRVVARIASGRGRMIKAKGGKIKAAVQSLRALNDQMGSDRDTDRSIFRKQVKLQRDLQRLGVDYEGDEDNIGVITRRPLKDRKSMKKAEGGKVSSGMSALKQLAKKFEEALDSGDTEVSERLKRQMERLQPGSSKGVGKQSASSKEAVATFAKGGKVKAVPKVVESLQKKYSDLMSKVLESEEDTPEETLAELDKIHGRLEKLGHSPKPQKRVVDI
jgi:ribosomal protein S20